MAFLDKPKDKEKDSGYRELATRELARYKTLRAELDGVWVPCFQTLSDYFLPNLSDIDMTKTEGTTGWSDRIFDTTAIQDARTCTAGQGNWATPATEPWFAWKPPQSLNMEEDDDGAIWCGRCTEIALDELARSNYYRISGSQYKSRTVFGTGMIHIEEGKATTLNCRTRKIGTYCIAENDEGIVDTVYAEFELTARVAAQMFGEDKLGEKVKKAYADNDGKQMDKKFKFLHVIRPREETERIYGKADPENKPVASVYIGIDDKVCVKVSGYDEMPDSVTRFDDWGSGTPWGYSPAFETLPNVRQLNYVVRFMDAQYELRANPRILEPIGLSGQVDLRPGGRTTFDPNMGEIGLPREWMTQADIRSTEESAEKKRAAIHSMFYTDVFTALQSLPPRQHTAYEIAQRLGEKLEQLSPMFMRLISEKTGPDLKRVFGILFRANKFPPPPRSMYVQGEDKKMRLAMPEVTYTSRLALALKALQNKATTDELQFISEFAANTGRAEVFDNFDIDGAARSHWINAGAAAQFVRPMKNVIQLRSARAKQAQQERTMAMAEQAATAAGKLGKAPQQMQDAMMSQMPGGGGT